VGGWRRRGGEKEGRRGVRERGTLRDVVMEVNRGKKKAVRMGSNVSVVGSNMHDPAF